MREHGVLKRALLVYREVLRRIDAHRDFSPDVLADSAKLIRRFVEDYHEKLEEDNLFPRFRKANRIVDLVEILNSQHQKGRILTDRTLQLVSASAQLFGGEGFEKHVDAVAAIEKRLGIYDLAQFTPRV
jgi:hemerythrin-like domain-containing protein